MTRTQEGFTLIELMMVIVITGVLMTIALPSFSDLIQSNRVTSQANDFITALSSARAEAIRRGAPVCIKRLGTTEKDWSSGWETFVDGNSSRTFSNDANRCSTKVKDSSNNDVILQTYGALSGDNTLKSDGTNFKTAIRFNALGVAVDNTDTGINDAFSLCRKDNETGKSKQISVSISGIISVTNKTCS